MANYKIKSTYKGGLTRGKEYRLTRMSLKGVDEKKSTSQGGRVRQKNVKQGSPPQKDEGLSNARDR